MGADLVEQTLWDQARPCGSRLCRRSRGSGPGCRKHPSPLKRLPQKNEAIGLGGEGDAGFQGVEVLAGQAQLGGGVFGLVDDVAEGGVLRTVLGIPAQVLARDAHAHPLAVEARTGVPGGRRGCRAPHRASAPAGIRRCRDDARSRGRSTDVLARHGRP